MEKEIIDKLFGPAINQAIPHKTNFNWTAFLLIAGMTGLGYFAYKHNQKVQKENSN